MIPAEIAFYSILATMGAILIFALGYIIAEAGHPVSPRAVLPSRKEQSLWTTIEYLPKKDSRKDT